MRYLFISDLHLEPERPDITRAFFDFLEQETPDSDALYILGDLFEVWIGDDHLSEFTFSIIHALKKVTEKNIPIFILPGNRDFLLGEDFCAMTDCQLIPEYTRIEIAGLHCLLMHGDLLCTQDIDYLNFRAQVRNPQWQTEFLAKPLAERLAFAQQARAASQQNNQNKTMEIMDVTEQSVIETLEKYPAQILIHGHTHRPNIHHLKTHHGVAHRIVLGDWYEQKSWLTLDEKGISNYRMQGQTYVSARIWN